MSDSREPLPPPTRRAARAGWLGLGLLCVGLGSVGVVVPGLPTTVFFIGAAACFARSSPRLERWVLGLPGIGPLVQDYRDGLGMPLRAKGIAIAVMAVAVSLSLWAIPSWLGRSAVATLGLVGVVYLVRRVPTRERVLAERIQREREHAE
ncbi:MAG: YbaN family protein [Bacteroidota bacterium]